ncbi:hypothetical protein AVEN_37127-1 [Araneus ventricosus]|uniref:Uncharacterized protein n=1 Tax=Araneus ventricosus TaxID=182803 RepID=A0A4Y2WGB0_ARAVE|nr:hypothetical protein AVEN_5620-1 [Araneus ventricosus]GBO36506.1 hypothetical protein AVEN_37127-1 [Araneus ventricosus]
MRRLLIGGLAIPPCLIGLFQRPVLIGFSFLGNIAEVTEILMTRQDHQSLALMGMENEMRFHMGGWCLSGWSRTDDVPEKAINLLLFLTICSCLFLRYVSSWVSFIQKRIDKV